MTELERLYETLGLESPKAAREKVAASLLQMYEQFSDEAMADVLNCQRRTGKTTNLLVQAVFWANRGEKVIIRFKWNAQMEGMKQDLKRFQKIVPGAYPVQFARFTGSELEGLDYTLVLDDEPGLFKATKHPLLKKRESNAP